MFADRGEAGPSDHIAILNAYWEFNQRSGIDKMDFARENFLGIKTLKEMGDLKRQLLQVALVVIRELWMVGSCSCYRLH